VRNSTNAPSPTLQREAFRVGVFESSDAPLRLPSYISELDGLRGLAIAAVLIYHCHPKLHHFGLDSIAQWGWAGVNLFFVLSGFLITGIIADSRHDPHFFQNFYARRGLRIWPVYFLLLFLVYVFVPFTLTPNKWWAWHEFKAAPWLYYVLFVQNLFPLALPGTIGPTWSLAIEEQFYIVWAPVARFFRTSALVPVLIAIIIASPFIRILANGRLTATHTLIHLDGLAVGSLISLSLRYFDFSRQTWKRLSALALSCGLLGSIAMVFRGSAFTDSALALGFGGMLIAALLANSSSNLYSAFLNARPLKFLGTISYGLYMIHILTFVLIGAFDEKMQRYGALGDFTVVLVRLALSISAASLMWYGFEKPILRLKRYFQRKPEVQRPVLPELVPLAEVAD
jgi:peptidoglycan/LPS O-acetylase OafA/YrhL